MSVLQDGKLAGRCGFNNYHVLHEVSWCEVSVAIDDAECEQQEPYDMIFEYGRSFKQLGVSRLQAVSSVTNLLPETFMSVWASD